MATTRKAAPDPLVEELPPAQELKPQTADDVRFDVEITPYIVNGEIFFRWDIRAHTHEAHIGSYVGHGASTFETPERAQADVQGYVDRIRHTVALKLNLPEPYRITL